MNCVVFAVCLTLITFTLAEQYTDRYDNINVDDILANRRLFVSYMKCVLGKGRCTAEGKELKGHITDAMQTACEKCTEFQGTKARKVIKYVKEHEKEYWQQLKTKYDPGDKYKPVYEAFLAKEE